MSLLREIMHRSARVSIQEIAEINQHMAFLEARVTELHTHNTKLVTERRDLMAQLQATQERLEVFQGVKGEHVVT